SRLELDVQRRVPGQDHHHVIEKGNAGGDLRLSASTLELQPDSRLSRLPFYDRHSVNSSATARGSTAPVYSAMPTIAAATPRSASARRSLTPVIPPAAYAGKADAATTSSISSRSGPRINPSR